MFDIRWCHQRRGKRTCIPVTVIASQYQLLVTCYRFGKVHLEEVELYLQGRSLSDSTTITGTEDWDQSLAH